MVVVNGITYACQSCIKGHRSSSCRHNERPLFQVQRKGRPVSQCGNCRELRETKRVHAKCLCNGPPTPATSSPVPPAPRHSKYNFNAPDLPNGLKDIPSTSASSSSTSKSQLASLLNPCTCKNAWACACPRTNAAAPSMAGSPVALPQGLAVLAQAAALLEVSESSPARTTSNPLQSPAPLSAEKKRPREGSHSPKPQMHEPKRTKPTPVTPPAPTPPTTKSSCCSSKSTSPPAMELAHAALLDMALSTSLPLAPPPSSLTPEIPVAPAPSPASDACCCGFQCTCPGCVEHRGPAQASGQHIDCASGACSTCVDHRKGIALELPAAEASDLGSFVSSHRLDAMFSAVRTSAARES